MIVVLDEKHKKDLKWLARIEDDETLRKFCELAVQFITKGFDRQAFVNTSNELGLKQEPLKRAVDSLCYLFAEASRLNLSESDFNDSIVVLDYDTSVAVVLKEYYIEHHKRIRTILSELSFDLPSYENLEWRLDVEMGSRALRQQIKPVFVLQLETSGAGERGKELKREVLEVDPVDLKHITNELDAALGELKQGYVRRVLRNIK